MNKLAYRKQLLLAFYLTLISIATIGQNCFCISGTKDKTKGIETIGGVTNSKDFYSLLIQKEMNFVNESDAPRYFLTLNAASKVLLSDSTLKTKGTVELLLLDNSLIVVDNVTYLNNPMGYCCSLGFQCEVSETIIKTLSQNPIVTLTVKGILSTSFAPRKQKEQQKIYNCLLNRKANSN